MSNGLKPISFEELEKMAKRKCLYEHIWLRSEDKKKFEEDLNLLNRSKLIDANGMHYILSKSERDYIQSIKIVSQEDCAEHTSLSKFGQNKKHLFLAGDPYLVEGTVKGIFKSKFREYLVIKTVGDDFLLAKIKHGEEVVFLQIVE